MITVHWSTHDLDEYYAQIKQIPRLSKEEQQQLVTLLAHSEQGPPAHAPDTLRAARHRLMEGHLRRAAAIAVRECPPWRYRLLPELIEAANLVLVEAMRRCDMQHPADLSSYLLATVRGAVRRVLANENLIRVPDTTRQHARAHGTAERFAVFATASLEVLMHPFEDEGEREPCAAPLLPTTVAPARDPALRAQVERWLAWLSPRAQAVLRLRYGLSDEDERAYSLTEIARLLGLPFEAVQQTERSALRRLRALLSDETCLNGTDELPRRRRMKPHTRRVASTEALAEQDAHLMQTATRLRAQGLGVTLRRLTQESGIPAYRVQAFLKAHRNQFPAVTAADKHQQALAEVAHVYAQLLSRGEAVTSSKKLAKAAHVRIDTALEFLRAERSKQDAIA